jgi:uncharacterized protein YndB with AHSA1/START domain
MDEPEPVLPPDDPDSQPEQRPEPGPVTVTREIDLDADPNDVWPLVAEPLGWAEWLADEVDLEGIEPGATGTVVDDDGLHRAVRVDDVEPGRSVRFTWWPLDEPGGPSAVELVVLGGPEGSRVRIVETQSPATGYLQAQASTGGARPVGNRWEWRIMALWTASAALARV